MNTRIIKENGDLVARSFVLSDSLKYSDNIVSIEALLNLTLLHNFVPYLSTFLGYDAAYHDEVAAAPLMLDNVWVSFGRPARIVVPVGGEGAFI